MNDTTKAQAVFATSQVPAEQSARLNDIKGVAAQLWTLFDSIKDVNSDTGRYISLAKTTLEDSVMWSSKAISRITQY